MNVLLHDSHNPHAGGAPGEAEWVMQLNDRITAKANAVGISVVRVPGDLQDHPEFHSDYDVFLAPHYDANIYGEGGWFWDRAAASTTADKDDAIGAIFQRRYLTIPNVPPSRFNRRNANTRDYYGFRLTSVNTPGYLVEHGVGAVDAPDYQWLRDNLDVIAQTHVDTWCEVGGIAIPQPTLDPRFKVLGNSAPMTVPNVDPSIVALYVALAPVVGIRAEIAMAQAIHETGWFKFDGTVVTPDWHNPCGLGVGANPIPNRPNSSDCKFTSWEAGIRAHLGHLLAYFKQDDAHIVGYCDADPRHFPHKKYSNDVRQLNGRWAVPGPTYGEAIANVVDSIVVPIADFWSRHSANEIVTWGDLKAYDAQRH